MTPPTKGERDSLRSRFRHLQAKGILSPEWQDFRTFLNDLHPAPHKHALKRIDNNYPIGPNNWQWVKLTSHKNNAAKIKHWQQNNPERVKDIKLQRLYGISYEGFLTLSQAQGGKCKICEIDPSKAYKGRSASLCVDHCHKTNKIRGLLCYACNTMLGKVKESIPTLQNAIEYLQEHDT